MAQGDPAGWESLGANDPTLYRATFSYNRVQGSGQIKQRVKAIANRSNGNYDVYTTAFGSPDQLIYSYNASNDKTTVSNTGIYNQIFTGPRIQQLTNLNSGVRKATLQLAENNVSGGPNSISSRDLQQLKNSTGYKSLANAVPAPPPPPKKDPPLAANPAADPSSGGGANPNASSGADVGGATLTSFSENERANNGTGILRYPRDHTDDYDYLMIQPIEYVPGFGLGAASEGLSIKRASARISEKKSATGPRIYLPMTSGISETNSVGWGEDSLNPIQLKFGQIAFDAINGAGSDLAGAMSNLGSGLMTAGQELLNDPNPKNKSFGARVVVTLNNGKKIIEEQDRADAHPYGSRPFKETKLY